MQPLSSKLSLITSWADKCTIQNLNNPSTVTDLWSKMSHPLDILFGLGECCTHIWTFWVARRVHCVNKASARRLHCVVLTVQVQLTLFQWIPSFTLSSLTMYFTCKCLTAFSVMFSVSFFLPKIDCFTYPENIFHTSIWKTVTLQGRLVSGMKPSLIYKWNISDRNVKRSIYRPIDNVWWCLTYVNTAVALLYIYLDSCHLVVKATHYFHHKKP